MACLRGDSFPDMVAALRAAEADAALLRAVLADLPLGGGIVPLLSRKWLIARTKALADTAKYGR